LCECNAMNYPLLKKQISECTLCAKHLPLGARPVIQFHPDAKILIAGHAPGKKVHQTGIPFDDPSGERLRRWMGVDHSDFYDASKIAILPLGFCYPGTGKSGDLPPRFECADTWRDELLNMMSKIELTLVVGQYAIDWHLKTCKKTNLTETVSAWQEYWPNLIPLPHPSPRNNIWLKRNPWFEVTVVPALQRAVTATLQRL